VVHNSDTARQMLGEYVDGDRSLPEDIRDILSRPNLDAGAIKDLSVSGALVKLMGSLDDAGKAKIRALLDDAKT